MCHNYPYSKIKQRPQHWHKLLTHITFISHCQNIEKTLLPYMTKNFPIISHQHGFKRSSHTALLNICHQITKSFNNPRPPQCTVTVALDMSKVFDTVNIHKLTLTNIPNIIIKFMANYSYIKGQQACAQYNGTLSKLKQINTGVPQHEILSPTLLNIHTSDIPLLQKMCTSQHMLMT